MRLQLFGAFSMHVDGRLLPPLRSRRGHWLLALLALQRGRELDRVSLAGLLWSDSAHAQALYNLRRALTELRDALGPDAPRLSSPQPHTLALDLAAAEVDVLTFDAALARGDEGSLERAVELYRGPLLAECDEEWVLPERAAREAEYLEALERLARHTAARGDEAGAICRLRQVVTLDPFRESAQQALLKALVASGDTIGALLAYRAFRLRLHQELRAEPAPETKALFQELRAQARRRTGAEIRALGVGRWGLGIVSEDPTPSPASRVPAQPATLAVPRRLPRPLSRFVGRETALLAVEACLESARLVTLTGPGGVGKTRLAIQVADGIAADYVDGVWFVDLTRLSDPAHLPQAVASVLGAAEQPDRPRTEALAEFLRSKQLLLVLDNCEHLLSACAELVEALLAGSPALRVLATSRQSLGLTGEVAWQLPGLSIPPEHEGVGCRVWGVGSDKDTPVYDPVGPYTPHATPHTLLGFEAVRLFVERGTEATAGFALTEGNARSVGEICRRLDGIPLALELAAARLKALSAEEIAARLDDAFRLLTGGSRTAQPRQQTLRAAMDWSYELLSEPERRLLQRLSVFAGSFSLRAVEGVCGDFGFWILDFGLDPAKTPTSDGAVPLTLSAIQNPKSKIQNFEVLDLLTQLVDKSLVVVEAGPETRYRLLETVRQYALERLRGGTPDGGPCEEERVRRRHLEYYLRLAEETRPHLWGEALAAWTERLEIEMDNLRAALDWALAREPERALRLATALAGFWIQLRYPEEGRQRLAAALEGAAQARRSPAGAWALTRLGHLALARDAGPAARGYFEESLSIWRELEDAEGIAGALEGLGQAARRGEQYPEARALYEESLALRRALGDRYGIADSLIGLADTLEEQGIDPSAWAGSYEEALAIRRELGYQPGVANALGQLANIAWRQGDYAQARRHREESLALWRALGFRIGVIHSLGALGHMARDQEAYEDARAFYTESLHLRWELGDPYTLAQALVDFAVLAAREGQWARMTRLLGAAETLREGMGKPLNPRERGEYERYLGGAHAALGEAAAAAAWVAGQAMGLEEAVASALESGAR